MYKNRTPTHVSWESMKMRCNGVNDPSYPRYGGKGIKVCERWKKFKNFLEDMGERPPGKTLDRIDNTGNYSPENCKWSTKKEQQRNKSNNRVIFYQGKSQTLAGWVEEFNLNKATISKRLQSGWEIDRVFSVPIRFKKR